MSTNKHDEKNRIKLIHNKHDTIVIEFSQSMTTYLIFNIQLGGIGFYGNTAALKCENNPVQNMFAMRKKINLQG